MKKRIRFKSIRMRILAGFSIVLFLFILVAAANLNSIRTTNNLITGMVDDNYEPLIIDKEMVITMQKRTSLLRGYLLYGDSVLKNEFNDGIDEAIELENKFVELSTNKERADEIINKKIEWGNLTDEVVAAYDNGDEQRAQDIMSSMVRPLEEEITSDLQEMSSKRQTEAKDASKHIKRANDLNFWVTGLIVFISILIGIIAALITAKSLSKGITSVMNRMNIVASGDLSEPAMEVTTEDEIGKLVQATNQMTNNTRELVSEINNVSTAVSSQSEEMTQASNEVKAGTEQIAVTMEELATGTETQANSATDLSENMSVFTSKAEEANENGKLVDESSTEVKQMTEIGTRLMGASTTQMAKIDQIVREAVTKVDGLDQQSQEISQLVAVIQDVAEQTNLLALNAAIEAARAGEHGKGFAVVADEVRKLAEQVGNSVSHITTIVSKIQEESSNVAQSLEDGYTEVEEGTIQIKHTASTFGDISTSIETMNKNIDVITTNLVDIVSNSQEMNNSIEEIASVSEEAAAGVEETAASAQQTSSSMEDVAGGSAQLAKMADHLNELVNRFKI